ncbi:MAG: MBL fold metallo-hydrolase [Gammaproteobacteria bacterium]|jgi:cyclase|nr:MBL fold metallo-hydrolase [Gammaproteobacteria bacterium]MBT4493593.1 MBL fold metallo-hydrolase [Gammaproteobacteria bacterium]MBT7371102.1 MBL fold metallo-hydrolase [Gammaproteobacteria bacterium]
MKNLIVIVLFLFCSTTWAHSGPEVPETMDLDTLAKTFGWDFKAAQIKTEKVGDDLFVLFGLGGNIAVSVGEDGVFIVDDQFPQIMPKIKKAIRKLGGKDVDFAVTTHWHFDHAEGNLALGPDGVWLVAQENSREMMKGDHIINLVITAYEQKAYPESAWPDITFSDAMQFHLNGQQIDLLHFGPAHTTGDAAVIFRGTNAVHLGDVYNNTGYPFIDAGNGGTLDGVIHFCSETLKQINKETIVIPGHGPIADYNTLKDYIEMLSTIRDRLNRLIDEGKSLEEVYAAKPTAEYDEKMGDNTGFLNRAYMSLTHKRVR